MQWRSSYAPSGTNGLRYSPPRACGSRRILTAEGAKQSAILTAEGEQQSQVLVARGQAQAIEAVFEAIHRGRPDAELLAYQYLQTLPKIADGAASKLWLLPSELTQALNAFAAAFAGRDGTPQIRLPDQPSEDAWTASRDDSREDDHRERVLDREEVAKETADGAL